MSYTLAYTDAVLATLEALSETERTDMRAAFGLLADNPYTELSQELPGGDRSKRMVGLTKSALAFYYVVDSVLVITVIGVTHASLT